MLKTWLHHHTYPSNHGITVVNAPEKHGITMMHVNKCSEKHGITIVNTPKNMVLPWYVYKLYYYYL